MSEGTPERVNHETGEGKKGEDEVSESHWDHPRRISLSLFRSSLIRVTSLSHFVSWAKRRVETEGRNNIFVRCSHSKVMSAISFHFSHSHSSFSSSWWIKWWWWRQQRWRRWWWKPWYNGSCRKVGNNVSREAWNNREPTTAGMVMMVRWVIRMSCRRKWSCTHSVVI